MTWGRALGRSQPERCHSNESGRSTETQPAYYKQASSMIHTLRLWLIIIYLSPWGSASSAADGCYHVFLDAGANVGMHTRFLFEPKKYPRATYPRDVFDPWFGRERDPRTTCSFGFEPNPAHQHHHEDLQRFLAATGRRYAFFMVGLGATVSDITFYRNNAISGGSRHHSWGFGTTCRDGRCHDNVSVPVIDFAAWIEKEVVGRSIPAGPATVRPRVILKMDIETAEFSLIPRMIANDTFCRSIDYATIEWHPHMTPMEVHTGGGTTTLDSHIEALAVQHALEAVIDARSREVNCHTNFTHGDFDDESYSMGGRARHP